MKRFLNLIVYILTIHVSAFTDRRTVSPGTFYLILSSVDL